MTAIACQWSDALYRNDAERDDIEGLLTSLPAVTVFNSLEWVEAAAEEFETSRTLLVLTIRDDRHLLGWVPMSVGNEWLHGICLPVLRLIGYPWSDRVALALTPAVEVIQAFLDALSSAPGAWEVAAISELYDPVEHSRLDAILARHYRNSYRWRHCSRSPVLTLDVPDLSSLRKSHGKSLAMRLRRAKAKIAKAGSWHVDRMLPKAEECSQLIDLVKRVEDFSWKGQRGLGIFSSERGESFFRRVATAFAQRGWLDVSLLYLDDHLISYRFGFRNKGSFLDYNLAFHPDYAAYSPGRLLLDSIIESSYADGLNSVDASRSSIDEPHLLADWTRKAVDHHELWLYRGVRGHALRLLHRYAKPALAALRRKADG